MIDAFLEQKLAFLSLIQSAGQPSGVCVVTELKGRSNGMLEEGAKTINIAASFLDCLACSDSSFLSFVESKA